MKKLVLFFLTIIMLVSVSGCGADDESQAEKNKKASQVTQSQLEVFAPNVTLRTLDGNTVQLKDLYMDKPVYLNFWASWCPP